LALDRPVAASSYCIWVPLLGGLWVATNVLSVFLGTHIAYPLTCSFLAGILNGTILSVIAVAKASERFQAGTTGLLSGLSLSGLRNDGSLLAKAAQGIHSLVDAVLGTMDTPGTVKFHNQIEQQCLYIVWITLFVVMASLVAEWVRTSRTAT
jgi:hypothetical protein